MVATFSKKSIENVTTVQLSKREQIQTRGQKTEPGCPADWVEIDCRRISVKETPHSQFEEERFPELEQAGLLVGPLEVGRERYSQDQHGHNDEKPGERSGHSHIEYLPAGKERRTDSNHCTKGAKWIQGQYSQPGDGNNGRSRNNIG